MTPNKVAIIQARMGSTRLPGKVLADVAGTPLLLRIIDRVRHARLVDEVVVATTTNREDDELVDFLTRNAQCRVFRGVEDDVLDRFYHCAAERNADIVIRITADDPLKDPSIIDQALQQLLDDPALDYASNTLQPTYPEGLDVEVIRFGALERAHRAARLSSEREHVTPYIWKHPELFNLGYFGFERDLSDWRWTVDKPNDLEFMRVVYQHFIDSPLVSFVDVIAWLENQPAVRAINADTERNEGYLRSIASEQAR